ncbi:Nramp family divalent metal transporter [Tundrisphaera lichenicola]|uniref:Nramp family divalent metal transporter n=1 Tax=Tundrisphaera lichenicola TaxID=2029860 RepID=UPI003EB7CC9E
MLDKSKWDVPSELKPKMDKGMMGERHTTTSGIDDERKSLSEVHGSVGVAHSNPLKRLFAFMGPAYLVSVGYMDPGNWATDLEGGARFGYALIWVLLMSNIMAVILQTLSARLGVVTGHDLAQACRAEYSRPVNFALWVLAEVAIAACDLAEVVGTVIALNLLFGIPLLLGCLVTALDTFLLLYLQRFGMRMMEAAILGLVAMIGGCFLIQIVMARPDASAIILGLRPSLPAGSLFVAIGILGATVMPHNLYLHSALVQSRRIGTDRASKAQACWYNLIDSALALNVAFLVNAAILVLSAAVFYGKVEVDSIEKAHELLPILGPIAPILFGFALLCAGQSSTLTGTLAGQIIMEGYLDLKIAPWMRRLITRSLALIPAVLTIWLAGENSTLQLLVLSQVILSLQLSFAVIPLIHFTSNRRNMGEFATRWWGQILAWSSAAVIVGLNAKLVYDNIEEWVGLAAASGRSFGPVPLSWVVAGSLYGVSAAALGLLIWVTIKPIVRPGPTWKPEPLLELDWSDTLRPRTITRIGVALERGSGDSEILSRALSLAIPGRTGLVLLHVVDSPMTRVYGEETADRETGADQRYLAEIVEVLRGKGFDVHSVLLHGPDRAGKLIKQLKGEPVDLLVVGSHGHGIFRDLLFGETVEKVRHGLSIPMLIARPKEEA